MLISKKEYNKRIGNAIKAERDRFHKEQLHRDEMSCVWRSLDDLRSRVYKLENKDKK